MNEQTLAEKTTEKENRPRLHNYMRPRNAYAKFSKRDNGRVLWYFTLHVQYLAFDDDGQPHGMILHGKGLRAADSFENFEGLTEVRIKGIEEAPYYQ